MIDGRNLDLERGTGVATYARNLSYSIRDLGHRVGVLYGNKPSAKMSPAMREIAFFDTYQPRIPPLAQAWRDVLNAVRARRGFAAIPVPMTGLVIADAFAARLPYFDAIHNCPDVFRIAHANFSRTAPLRELRFETPPDLMHWTYPLPLRASRVPNVYTLHDLVPLRLPHTTLDNKRRYFRLVSAICERADHIVTVSESSKADIVRLLGVPPSRVTNTYQSVFVPPKYLHRAPEAIAAELEGIFGLEYRSYYLFWGSIEPKKNIGRMIEAYLSSGVATPLVIVGAQAWKSEHELKLLEDLQTGTGRRNNIIRLSYVPFALLMSLIQGARAALFPSLYEGFGLPVLEAMQLGTPVITGNTASLPEVAGDACITVNPYDTQEIARAIATLDADAGHRGELAARGLTQAARFSPAAHAERLASVYDRLQ
jgi:glycosyltransferase involved in cell wall biosynthesis